MYNTIVKNSTSQGIDKTAIKNFAVYARSKLIKDIKNKAAMIGVTERGIQEPLSTSTGNIQLFDIGMQEPYRIEGKAIEQRNGLTRELEKRAQGSTYKTAYETLIEEVAYTWFNRIIAIRFMEVNNYMPDRMRVLSSGVEGINEPEFITHVFETNFDFSEEEKERIIELKTDGSNLAMDELFQKLFIKQCNALNANLPELFEKTNDYTELLLTVSYNDIEGVIYKLVHDLPEANFDVNSEDGDGQVEIIGWLYQYYNSERKDEVINVLGGKAIKKEDIPAATQLFTTDWIVRYMVDNSLGKYWMERNPHSDLIHSLEYLVSKDIEEVDEKILPEDIKFLDNCMGSGHILVYAFDVLMKIYESEGYTTREAARLVVEKNLYGLEIDKRSYQLSYFAIMMKARQYNRKILNEDLQNNLYVFQDSTSINQDHLQYLGTHLSNDERKQARSQLNYLIELFKNAEELGSIIIVEGDFNPELLLRFIEDFDKQGQISFETIGIEETPQQLINLIEIANLLKQKYEVVVTNPPYLNKYDKELKKYIMNNYRNYSGDLFSIFIYRNAELLVGNGYSAYMSPFVWMFIKTYEELRKYIIQNKNISSLIQLEYSAFEEATVPICTFVLQNSPVNKKGHYIKLSEYKGGMKVQRNKTIEAINNPNCEYKYHTSQANFNEIPGSPIAYWVPFNRIVDIYQKGSVLVDIVDIRKGLATGNVPLFIKYWHEISSSNFSITSTEAKWFPCHKGGEFNKWYGNFEKVINWENDGLEIKNYRDRNGKLLSRPQNLSYMQKKGIVFSKITSGGASCRVMTGEELFDDAVQGIFVEKSKLYNTILGLLNSKISGFFLNFLNPTLNKQIYDLNRIAVIEPSDDSEIDDVISDLIYQSKQDWDSFESSWEFESHPLITYQHDSEKLSQSFENWTQVAKERFNQLKEDEEKLNRIFIDNYGLQEELTHEVENKDVTVHRAELQRDVKSFLSYLVGIIFGRYSLDEKGLAFAGGELNSSKYKTYQPVTNNLILLTQENYFNEDIVTKIEELVAIIYGETYIEENMQFLASAIGMRRNTTSRDTIRNYFINDFYKDHTQTYKKRPIYWLYDSGKKNGFKALVYMHRYDEDTTGKVRVDYLHQVQRAYERNIANLQEDIANSNDAKETSQLQKRLEKVTKQLKECRDYDERLGHMTLERVAIDLDDGVKVNYEKVQTDSEGKFHQILAKIK